MKWVRVVLVLVVFVGKCNSSPEFCCSDFGISPVWATEFELAEIACCLCSFESETNEWLFVRKVHIVQERSASSVVCVYNIIIFALKFLQQCRDQGSNNSRVAKCTVPRVNRRNSTMMETQFIIASNVVRSKHLLYNQISLGT